MTKKKASMEVTKKPRRKKQEVEADNLSKIAMTNEMAVDGGFSDNKAMSISEASKLARDIMHDKENKRQKERKTEAEHLSDNVIEVPKCGVIIRKNPGDIGIACPEDAKYVIQIADPDDHVRITGILLLCERHAAKFDGGQTLLTRGPDGELSLTQSVKSDGESDTIEAEGSDAS
jgi:hypothetical protein